MYAIFFCLILGFSLTRCQKQLQEVINHSQDPDKSLPRCKYDGSYEEIQCHKATGKCWCVDGDGNILPSTATNKSVTCPSTTGESRDLFPMQYILL